MKRYLVPSAALLLGSALITSFYLGTLTWLQGWEYASGQFARNRLYVVPSILGFGVQVALFSILRFRLFAPIRFTRQAGSMMGASGGSSAAAMVACCLHHVTDVLPILGLSAAAIFLAHYQRPFMLVGFAMNLAGLMIMLVILLRDKRKLHPILETP